jgi:hypothetical protein
MLLYKEVATEGICDATNNNLPTVPGLPAAAYSRYCQSDIGLFSDNTDDLLNNGGGIYDDNPGEGFDNQLRVCPIADGHAHTAAQDVERAALGDTFAVEPQGPLNLNCTTGGNTDSGKYKIKIPDQAPLLATNIDVSPLTDAPKLEGVSPLSTSIIIDGDGVRKLELIYPTCGPTPGEGLSANIIDKYHPTNNSDVTLTVEGQTDNVGLGPILFESSFTIKVTGVQ